MTLLSSTPLFYPLQRNISSLFLEVNTAVALQFTIERRGVGSVSHTDLFLENRFSSNFLYLDSFFTALFHLLWPETHNT